ncbi:hypothetical protein APHAL10511_007659 [Amanita phalloides]|nr:hypothetical protein APHAL10511_007659 [Amanita phalloides]
MHFTLILWISLLLSTAIAVHDHWHGPAYHGPNLAQIEALKEGQVIETFITHDNEHKQTFAIYLGHTRDEAMKLKVVLFRRHMPYKIPPEHEKHFFLYFRTVFLDSKGETGAAEYLAYSRLDPDGTKTKLNGAMDLRVYFLAPEHVLIPHGKPILERGMRRLKASVSVASVNEAVAYDSHVRTSGQTKSFEALKIGQVVWISSKIMYGNKEPKHAFHFAIFLGFADPPNKHKLNIAQIVMNLPFPAGHRPECKEDFNNFFPTTWWWEDEILLDGDIDLTLHKIDQDHIHIPNTRLILDSTGVKQLEHRMATFRQRHRSSSLPANYHEHSDDSGSEGGSEGGRISETHLTRHNSV